MVTRLTMACGVQSYEPVDAADHFIADAGKLPGLWTVSVRTVEGSLLGQAAFTIHS